MSRSATSAPAAPFKPLSGAELDRGLDELANAYPWPSQKPNVEGKPDEGWLLPATQEMLRRVVSKEHRLIVELGSFLGLSTRFIAKLAPQAKVVAIDHWQGSAEHYQYPQVAQLLPTLYETFLVNCWSDCGSIIPLRMHTLDGLREIAQHGLQPDVVFVDADHGYDALKADLQSTIELFPSALIVGDDWNWEGVQRAVTAVSKKHNREVDVQGAAWRLV